MYAYKETYLEDARDHLGEMFDYAINVYNMKTDEFWTMFACSKLAVCLSAGDPKYIAGMSGFELFAELIHEVFQKRIDIGEVDYIDRSRQYWAGWALALYQWHENVTFHRMYSEGIVLSDIVKMYILHEAPDEKFIEVMRQNSGERNKISMLKRLRAYAGLTQKQLSEASGVSLRMIQLYEQKQNDLAKAQAGVVLSLSQVLGCNVSDLV